jgi:uncharacterized protein YjbJ (UPF0337 family)
MNWDQLSGQWKQMQAHVKSKWAKLTDEDLTNLGAKKDMLVGKIQERYGILKDEAERQLDEWMASTPHKPNDARPAEPGQAREAERHVPSSRRG